MNAIGSEIITQKQASFEEKKEKRKLWDSLEQLFHNQLNDQISLNANSQVFDPVLATLVIERAYRVMSQLATGKVKGISNNDLGDAKLKNLLLDKYVVPNANAQFDLLTKFRLVDLYSNIYGSFDVLVDQDVKGNGYVGPDMWLLNKRDVFDQVGAVSLEDSDQVIVRTWKSISYFEGLKKEDGFTNIDKIVNYLKKLSGSKQNRDSENISKREEVVYPNGEPAKGLGYFEVLTRFQKDRWVDIVVDADGEVFRDQKSPHDDGELPVIRKYSQPLLDDKDGMGDFERGRGMQMAVNANWNLYFDGVELSNRPPIIVNKDNVASISSFQATPGAMWLGRNNVQNIAQPINLSPQGISTFNNTSQVANASLLKMFGTSDTTVTSQTDPGFGKTPEALKQQQARENTRDNADRFYMEQFVSKVMKKMCNLLSKKQSSAIQFRMFPDEIEQIARDYPEIKDQYNDKTGKLTVKKGRGSSLYDYEIVSGSTYALDQKSQQENLTMLMQLWLQSNTPQGNTLETQLEKDGYKLKFGELFKRVVSNSGIQDWDKILEEMTPQEIGDMHLEQGMQQFQQSLAPVGGGMNGIPPMPQGQPGMDQQQMPQQGQQPMPPQPNPMQGGQPF